MKDIAQKEGTPKKWHSDNGGEFTSDLIRDLIQKLGGAEVHGLPYKPRVQGGVERLNETLKNKLLKYIKDDGEW